jgi:tetratricopeptide (TPR) repeat protein
MKRFLLVAGVLLLTACVPSDADKAALKEGFLQYSNRQFDPAEAAAENYLKKNPTAPNIDEAHYLRGLARMSKNNPTGATEDLNTAIAKSQRKDLKAKAHRALGDIAYDAAQWEPAAEQYEKSLTFAPEQSDAHICYRAGAALQNAGQWDRARVHLQRAATIKTDPLSERAATRLNARNFSLQFGAFSDAARGADLVRQLKTAGITATATSELRDGKLLYLIRHGTFNTLAEAEKERTRFLLKFPTITIVP